MASVTASGATHGPKHQRFMAILSGVCMWHTQVHDVWQLPQWCWHGACAWRELALECHKPKGGMHGQQVTLLIGSQTHNCWRVCMLESVATSVQLWRSMNLQCQPPKLAALQTHSPCSSHTILSSPSAVPVASECCQSGGCHRAICSSAYQPHCRHTTHVAAIQPCQARQQF